MRHARTRAAGVDARTGAPHRGQGISHGAAGDDGVDIDALGCQCQRVAPHKELQSCFALALGLVADMGALRRAASSSCRDSWHGRRRHSCEGGLVLAERQRVELLLSCRSCPATNHRAVVAALGGDGDNVPKPFARQRAAQAP